MDLGDGGAFGSPAEYPVFQKDELAHGVIAALEGPKVASNDNKYYKLVVKLTEGKFADQSVSVNLWEESKWPSPFVLDKFKKLYFSKEQLRTHSAKSSELIGKEITLLANSPKPSKQDPTVVFNNWKGVEFVELTPAALEGKKLSGQLAESVVQPVLKKVEEDIPF